MNQLLFYSFESQSNPDPEKANNKPALPSQDRNHGVSKNLEETVFPADRSGAGTYHLQPS